MWSPCRPPSVTPHRVPGPAPQRYPPIGRVPPRMPAFPFAVHSANALSRSSLWSLSATQSSAPKIMARSSRAFDNARLDDETSEFDQMPGALATLDLPCAHVMPRPRHLLTVACRPMASQRHPCRGQALAQFAASGSERTRRHASPMPPSFRRPWSRPARSARLPVRRR